MWGTNNIHCCVAINAKFFTVSWWVKNSKVGRKPQANKNRSEKHRYISTMSYLAIT